MASNADELEGLLFANKRFAELGFERVRTSFQFRGNQGIDLVFRRGDEFAIVEAKRSSSLGSLATDTNFIRQGSRAFNESRLQRFIRFSRAPEADIALAERLIAGLDSGSTRSFVTLQGSDRVFQIPRDLPDDFSARNTLRLIETAEDIR